MEFALHVFLKHGEDFLVCVAFVAAHVDGKGAGVGNHVVLCASIDDGDGGFHGSQ